MYILKCQTKRIIYVSIFSSLFFFFFQAEDGIRDSSVTGVQTCALPISMPADAYYADVDGNWQGAPSFLPSDVELMVGRIDLANMPGNSAPIPWPSEIGRASCRERV